jgi:hypothetical protein
MSQNDTERTFLINMPKADNADISSNRSYFRLTAAISPASPIARDRGRSG